MSRINSHHPFLTLLTQFAAAAVIVAVLGVATAPFAGADTIGTGWQVRSASPER
jgi:hypothetical protein